MNSVLNLTGYSVQFPSKMVLSGVNLEVQPREIFVLMGPGGAGKSTLLRTICGANRKHSAMKVGGRGEYLGSALDPFDPTDAPRPVLVQQKAAMLTGTVFDYLASNFPMRSSFTRLQLRNRLDEELIDAGLDNLPGGLDAPMTALEPADRAILAIVRAALPDPALVCVDEPTAGMADTEADRVLAYVRRQAKQRAVLLVTHNQRRARQVGARTALLAGGRIQECLPTGEFFSAPMSEAARTFIRTGGCTVPSPDADPSELDPSFRASDATPTVGPTPVPAHVGPTGFDWLIPGQLGGSPMPGIVDDIDRDLDALERVGLSTLITLTEKTLPEPKLRARRIEPIHFPIVDMEAPELVAAADLCRLVEVRLDDGKVVVMHCKAGVGRTGTMLASYLIWKGATAREALARVRGVNPRWVQSTQQEEFLEEFELWLD